MEYFVWLEQEDPWAVVEEKESGLELVSCLCPMGQRVKKLRSWEIWMVLVEA